MSSHPRETSSASRGDSRQHVPDGPSFVELFTPKFITVMREGYTLSNFKADAIAGLTVAIVALPLSMAIAIASGVGPDRGLYTAIIGGFLVSLLGGSRFQIGGPAGAFIVLVATTVSTQGIEGLILATLLSGILLAVVGFLQLGTFIKYIPYPVTVGFSAGIAVIIFASQIKDLFGLTLSGPEPSPIFEKLAALADAMPTFSVPSFLLAAATIVIIIGLREYRPRMPGLLIAVALAAVVTWAFDLPVDTIGTRFGGIPQTLPAPQLPTLSIDKIIAVLPAAIAFTLLGSIESLLSAVVADTMTGRRHRSNCELVAQGVANVGSALFGGFCVTGTIARTATNVRAGAYGPMAGILHSVFLLLFILLAAPLASFIPLAALAGVLATVAWNMVEKHAVATLLRASRGDAVVLTATFLLTVFRDLVEGIVVGFTLSALLFLHRMAQSVEVENAASVSLGTEDQSDVGEDRTLAPYDTSAASDPDVVVSRISGAFFFGAAASVGTTLDQIARRPKAYVIDFSAVPFLDSTAASTIESFVRKGHARGALISISGARPGVRRTLLLHGVRHPLVHFKANIDDAVADAHAAVRAIRAQEQAAQA
ncbi:SulP family inorganic anion transporter [Pseudochelatococcus contaminans]|uniref:SulP family sulfate permease n=1 Tax=Pseudochelatococcus contaminans TaxID=1538103 RepID=A0A7W6EE13_9HYPH|nr:SulP family sulfate permease [Pseudochelatococcus contaminans]